MARGSYLQQTMEGSEVTQHDQLFQWQPSPLQDDADLMEAILAIHRDIYQQYFADEPMTNARLPIEIRAFRHIEQWRVFLLLTPWMLVRVLVPEGDPGVEIPPGWSAAERENAPYTLLGPALALKILGSDQKAHLAFHPQLGHYLIQPLVLSMQSYDSAEAVFSAWRQVIQTRNENMKRLSAHSRWQEDVSRREFFAKLVSGRSERV
jgi:hypothetical protein